jgi:hypothetical protein
MVTPGEYKTVFELGLRSFPWPEILGPIVVAIVGIAFFRFSKRELWRMIGGLMFIFGMFIAVVESSTDIPNLIKLRRTYIEGHSSVVAGPIENFQQMPYLGPSNESFSVGGVNFSYSPFDSTPCFTDTPPRRGPIHPGQYVRVHYDDGCIQRLEIRTDSVLSAAESSQFAKSEETKRKHFMESDPRVYRANLATTFVALIMSFFWNLDWRHYIEYWLRREPPYSRLCNVGFRLFFLLTFISAAVQMFRLTTEPFRTAVDFEKAGLLSLYGIGFFILADLFFRWRFRLRKGTSGDATQVTSNS